MNHSVDISIAGNGLVVIRSCRIMQEQFCEMTQFERLMDRGEAERLWSLANLCDEIAKLIARNK